MEIILAKTAGFCFGVDRAVKTVEDHISDEGVYTYGPIIHNPQVVEGFEKRGVKVLNDLSSDYNGTVIVRSHGAGPEVFEQLEEKKVNIVDTTCPFVKRIHRIVEKQVKLGEKVIIVGNKNHPEVLGISGWSGGEAKVISTIEEAKNLDMDRDEKICLVSQTTFDRYKFNKIVEILKNLGYNLNVFSTICNATHERQTEALELSKGVDKMIVIGGKNSSNTMKLYHICKDQCEHTYHIETIEDLLLDGFNAKDKVGITAGASTPQQAIEDVINTLRRVF